MKLCRIGIHKYIRLKKLTKRLDFYWVEATFQCKNCSKKKKVELLEG